MRDATPAKKMSKKSLADMKKMGIRPIPLYQGIVFIAAYVALDWASDLHALYGLNITPWNPMPALGLVYWFRYGKSTAIPWLVALLLGEITVRGLPTSILITLALSTGLLIGYSGVAVVMHRAFRTEGFLDDPRRLLTWLAIVIAGTLTTSVIYIAPLVILGLVPIGDWRIALARFWIGDFVGVVVTMPFFWFLIERRARLYEILMRWETAAYSLLAAAMLWVVFGLGGTSEFQYFYLLFPPIVWAAARQGVIGAAIAAFLLQAGIIVAVRWTNLIAVTVFELQMLGAVLASVGFFIGTVVDEKQRISRDLRQTLRLAAAAEMAGALAHELNQPLTAISAYGASVEHLLNHGETGNRLHETVKLLVAESFRASDVVRRLRDFVRTGATKLHSVSLAQVVESAALPYKERARSQDIALIIEPIPACTLLVDRVQIEVVMRNLLSNAFDAVCNLPKGERRVTISSVIEDGKRIVFKVEDSGAGVSEEMAREGFQAVHSSKSDGLGLGLAISSTIAQTHGGQLRAEPVGHGAFTLTLPIEGYDSDAL